MNKSQKPMPMKEAKGIAGRARGGAMTPSSPMSGATAPNKSYAKGKVPVDEHGKGKDSTKYRPVR